MAITLVQPVVWLLLFGALFKNLAYRSPTGNYLAYLTPGIVVMSALFSNGWAGMGFIERRRARGPGPAAGPPVRRGSVMARPAAYQPSRPWSSRRSSSASAGGGGPVPGWRAGDRGPHRVCAARRWRSRRYSNALALLLRSQESVIGAVNFVVLPLSFLSSMLVPTEHLPGWIAAIARWNPVEWSVAVGRQTLSPDVDWGLVGSRVAALAALAVVAAALAARAFSSYQRSV